MACARERGGWIIWSLVPSWGVWRPRAVRQHPHGERDPHGRGTPNGKVTPMGWDPHGTGPPWERDPHRRGTPMGWDPHGMGPPRERDTLPLGWRRARSPTGGHRPSHGDSRTVHLRTLSLKPASGQGQAVKTGRVRIRRPRGCYSSHRPPPSRPRSPAQPPQHCLNANHLAPAIGGLTLARPARAPFMWHSSFFGFHRTRAHGPRRWEMRSRPRGWGGVHWGPGFPRAGATAPVPTGPRWGRWRPRGGYPCWHPSAPSLQPRHITRRPRDGDSPHAFPRDPNRHRRSSGLGVLSDPFQGWSSLLQNVSAKLLGLQPQSIERIQSIRHPNWRCYCRGKKLVHLYSNFRHKSLPPKATQEARRRRDWGFSSARFKS